MPPANGPLPPDFRAAPVQYALNANVYVCGLAGGGAVPVRIPGDVFATSGGGGSGTLPSGTGNQVLATPNGVAGVVSLRAIVPADLAGTPAAGKYWDGTGAWLFLPAPGTGTVTSVDVAVPAYMSSTGGPIVGAGTITLAFGSQAQRLVFASPNVGAGLPVFRALVASDIPALSYVTSVGLSLPAEFTLSGTPVTSSGTLTGVWASQLQNLFFASPNGSSGTPVFRALVAADIPALSYVTSVALTAPTEITVGGSPITSSGTIALTWTNESANRVFAGPTTGAAATPTFRSLVTADLPAGTGTVTSVDMTLPTEFVLTGNPITASGTFTVNWATELAHAAFIGPASGPAAKPTFRALVASDLPAGTGTVTSVALTAPTEITVGGSPVTTAGTLALSWTSESANKVFAGPTTGGAATPTFRSLVLADLPTLSTSALTDAITQTSHGLVVGNVVRFNGTNYVTAKADSATDAEVAGIVTAVAGVNDFTLLTSGFINTLSGLVAGTTYFLDPSTAGLLTATEPITSGQVSKPLLIAVSTTAGYFMNMRGLVLGATAQAANSFYSGPASGAAAAPTFRAQVAEDIATGTPTSGYIPYAAGAGVKPAWGSLTLPPPVNASINLFNYQNSI